MQAQALALEGCFLLRLPSFTDARGDFRKLLHAPSLRALGLEAAFVESYISRSHRGVVRGMHFQRPPADHAKMVVCLAGRARDGLVDLRNGSPTYGQVISLMLDAAQPRALYIPRGVAHGFAAHADNTTLLYYTTSIHDPEADAGVQALDVGIDWWQGVSDHVELLQSPRDAALPSVSTFASPFTHHTPP